MTPEVHGGAGTRATAHPREAVAYASLSPDAARSVGASLHDLAALFAAGLPAPVGWIWPTVAADGGSAPLAELVRRLLSDTTDSQSIALVAHEAKVSPLRLAHVPSVEVRGFGDVEDAIARLLEAACARHPAGAEAVGILRLDRAPLGFAASVDPADGDPERLRVWIDPSQPWCIERKSMRIVTVGRGPLDAGEVALLADHADRAQLVLGRPVELGWCRSGGRLALSSARPLAVPPAFTREAYSMLSLLAPDEGPIAPLAVGALERALSRDAVHGEPPRVVRIFGRPYRRRSGRTPRLHTRTVPVSVARAALRTARVAADVLAPVAAAASFARTLRGELEELRAARLRDLDVGGLGDALRARHAVVVEAFVALDQVRAATLAALAALEAAAGGMPEGAVRALAAPRLSRRRRRIERQLAAFVARLPPGGTGGEPSLAPPLRDAWARLRRELADLRPLGIDVSPPSIGESDGSLWRALRDAGDAGARESARRDATAALLRLARGRALGRSRQTVVLSLLAVVGRVARAKGDVSEALADALLLLRSAALEVGERLASTGVVDAPDDAFYLELGELEEALRGEPGAYAARVRMRRDEDRRWAAYDAPRRIDPRELTSAAPRAH